MPTQAEIRFAKYGRELQHLISLDTHEWTVKLHASGQRFRASGQEFDQGGSKIPFGHTLAGQVKVDYIRFVSPKTEELEAVEVFMGHDSNWMPVIWVSSTNTDPVVIESKGVATDDMALIRKHVILCFESAGFDFQGN